MLTEEQITTIAVKLNEKVDLPFIGEEKEQDILESVLNGINGKLDEVTENLPEPARETWEKLADGVSDEEAERLVEQLTVLVNERIDIPLLSEENEAGMVIHPAVSMIVDTMRSMASSDTKEEAV